MRISQDVKPYEKIDGIHDTVKNLPKWQRLWLGLGKFVAQGLAGKWQVKFTWKF